MAKRTFTPESDLATLVKCYLEVEKSANPVKFCTDNGLDCMVFGKIDYRVREIYGAVYGNNPDAFIENVMNVGECDSQDDVSDAETDATSVVNER